MAKPRSWEGDLSEGQGAQASIGQSHQGKPQGRGHPTGSAGLGAGWGCNVRATLGFPGQGPGAPLGGREQGALMTGT